MKVSSLPINGKEKGVPIMKVFRYLLCIVFADRNMYMQLKTDAFKEDFSKNAVYRFLDNPRINWKKFTTPLCRRKKSFASMENCSKSKFSLKHVNLICVL